MKKTNWDGKKYTDDELLKAYYDKSKAKNRWLNINEINTEICGEGAVRRRFGTVDGFKAAVIKKYGNPVQAFLKEQSEAIYDAKEARDELNKIIKFNKQEITPPKKIKDNKTRILILPCLHVPFHSKKNFTKAIEWAKGQKVDTLVIAGDFIDALSMGHAGYKRNIRPKQYVSLQEELTQGKVILEYLAKSFPEIVMMRGNHPDRVRKWFAERVGPEMLFLVNHDVISLLAADFPNVKMVNTEDQIGNDISWIYQIGDCRICHAEVGSSIELRPTVRLHDWFNNWDYYLQMQPFNVLVECHTHQAGILPLNNGSKLLVEGACLCLSPQYSLEPKIPYKRPQTNGVTYLEQTNGVTDFNSVRQYIFSKTE